MSGKISCDELLSILKDMRKYINKPKNSGKAGEILILLRKIRKELDKKTES